MGLREQVPRGGRGDPFVHDRVGGSGSVKGSGGLNVGGRGQDALSEKGDSAGVVGVVGLLVVVVCVRGMVVAM